MSERYHRQEILPGFGEETQKKLRESRVLVIGAGGLGCPALQYLAAGGVGRLGICDGDAVSLSNLHRQVLYTSNDIGKLKAEVAAKRLSDMNPEVSIIPYLSFVTRHNVLNIIKDYQLVIDGTDDLKTKYLINDACALLNIPLVFGAVSGYEGQVAVFNCTDDSGLRTSYRDVFPEIARPDTIANCSLHGVMGVLPGIIGVMMATEAIKLLTGIGSPLINKMLHYDIRSCKQFELNLTKAKRDTLPANMQAFLEADEEQDLEAYEEIDAQQLAELQAHSETLLIDVREKFEKPRLKSGMALAVPLATLDSWLTQIPKETHIVFVCQHGIRSVTAAKIFLSKYGQRKKIYSLKGGITKWLSSTTP